MDLGGPQVEYRWLLRLLQLMGLAAGCAFWGGHNRLISTVELGCVVEVPSRWSPPSRIPCIPSSHSQSEVQLPPCLRYNNTSLCSNNNTLRHLTNLASSKLTKRSANATSHVRNLFNLPPAIRPISRCSSILSLH